MTLETFFAKFDQFADAPDAVAKMRELVLQLAVRGQLVAQNPKDEPASKAIERLVAQNGTGRTAKLFAEEESVALPFAVPASWKWVRFGDLVRIRTGKLDANAAVEGGEYPFFTCSKTPSQIATYSFDTSAVILAGNGDFNLKSYSGKFDAYQRTYVIEPLGWELGFCFWLISAQIKRITDNQRGSAIPYLRLGDIADPLVPFPPLAEQKRIVAKVDELMALCDRLEAQQQERETRHAALARASLARFADAPTPANLPFLFHPSYAIPPADLRKSILTLAVQGKLVSQDPNDEPAEELLERVASALPDKKSENPFLGKIETSIIDESEYELPPGWAWLPLGHVGIWATGCGFPMQYQGETDGEFLFCKVSDMNLPGNEVEIHTTVHKIDADVMKKIRAHANPVGTVIFPKIGGAIATHKRRLVIKPTIIDNNCSGIQPIGLTDDSWLLLFLRNLDLTKYQSGTSVPAVSQGSLDPIRIGLPPIAEQCRIVAKVEQLMALVDALETQLAASRATAANLLSALVAELTTATTGRPSANGAPPSQPGATPQVKGRKHHEG